jgi:hypothetical protein
VEKPNITGGPAFVVCKDVNPINLSAVQPTSGLVGYTYDWFYDPWSGTSSGSTATVTPNGLNAGNIRVIARACGLTAVTATKTIPLEVIHPDRKVQGPTAICPTAAKEFFLEQPLPPSSTTTWVATPANLATPSSGSGTSATVAGALGAQGFGKMTFTVNNQCGTASRYKDFYAGVPASGEILINGLPGPFTWLCPNDRYSIVFNSSTVGNPLAEERYDWVVDPGLTIVGGQGTPSIAAESPVIGGGVFYETYNGTINLTISNECGQTVVQVPFTIRDCGGLGNPARATIRPNPATQRVDLQILSSDGQPAPETETNYIRVVSQYGNLMVTQETLASASHFDVSSWPPGLYFVHLNRSGKATSTPFQVTRH